VKEVEEDKAKVNVKCKICEGSDISPATCVGYRKKKQKSHHQQLTSEDESQIRTTITTKA